MLFLASVPFVEGSCISDPCWYAVPNATGKEVVIFDLFPDTATNVLAKDLLGVRTETGAPLRVLCDPSAVSYQYLSTIGCLDLVFYFFLLRRLREMSGSNVRMGCIFQISSAFDM